MISVLKDFFRTCIVKLGILVQPTNLHSIPSFSYSLHMVTLHFTGLLFVL